MIAYYLIIGLATVAGAILSNKLKGTFKKYSNLPMQNGKSGAEVARDMLTHYGINDVKIVQGKGFLTDHYNPMSKTIALSPEVYNGRHVSAAAVAAHECGHAVQHAQGYKMLQTRSALVPIIKFSSRIQQMLFMGFLFGAGAQMGGLGNIFMIALVATFGVTALFSMVTLPVEFDASRRALVWLNDSNYARGAQYDGAKDSLWWAAMTYVANALASLMLFLYFFATMLGSSD